MIRVYVDVLKLHTNCSDGAGAKLWIGIDTEHEQCPPQIFVGRQPILDREQKLVAYELLFRGSQDASTAEFSEQGAASLRVIVNAFMTMGLDRVLGESLGFFNVVGAMIMSDLIEALPRERIVIEVLENVVVDDELRARCIKLKEKGFTLAPGDPEAVGAGWCRRYGSTPLPIRAERLSS